MSESRRTQQSEPTQHDGPGLFLRLNTHHGNLLREAAELAGVQRTEMLRRMIEHWHATGAGLPAAAERRSA